MPLHLDHAVISVQDLDAAVHDYRDLGFTVVMGGIHANRATHNALISFLDGTYLELLAATGEPPVLGAIDFSVLLQHGEGLVAYALRSDDLEADAARLQESGFTVSEVIPGERRRNDGIVIRWKLALLDGGFAPFLIQDVTPREWRVPNDPAVTTHLNRAAGLSGVEIAVREMPISWDRYTRLFGSSPRRESATDRSIGSVVLHEVEEGAAADRPEALFALHLVLDPGAADQFTLERTHGVRFRLS
jgi:catechol 2,3-dioxygenase-like lactoylglutathione lyase family enzyme